MIYKDSYMHCWSFINCNLQCTGRGHLSGRIVETNPSAHKTSTWLNLYSMLNSAQAINMILIWVYNRMQPLTNQDLPAMAAVLCNRQTIFRRQTIFPKLDTGSHEALTALTVAPIRRRK